MTRPTRVSPRVPSQDYRDMLACLQSHRRELIAFRDNPEPKIAKQEREVANLEMVLAAERARLDEMRRMAGEVNQRIDAVDQRIAEVRNQVVVKSQMEKIEKARQLLRELRALEADCGQKVTEDDIVS